MNKLRSILAIGSALILTACAQHAHKLVPEGAAIAGQLRHGSGNNASLELHYAGNRYVSEFATESARRIQGEHQRWPGRIARPMPVADNGDKLACEVRFFVGAQPTGTCEDKAGKRFDIRFD